MAARTPAAPSTPLQLALPGLAPPDDLAEARAAATRLRAAWEPLAVLTVENLERVAADPERRRLQREYFAALILVDRLESGVEKWWYKP